MAKQEAHYNVYFQRRPDAPKFSGAQPAPDTWFCAVNGTPDLAKAIARYKEIWATYSAQQVKLVRHFRGPKKLDEVLRMVTCKKALRPQGAA